jgi:hypothetical protein
VNGKRVYPDIDGAVVFDLLRPGEYRKVNSKWYAQPPWDHGLANLASHSVVEHEDGSITVSPSILVKCGNGIEWHGFLERGVWREC